jgi:tetratricopeptide (TPR) repeat protein
MVHFEMRRYSDWEKLALQAANGNTDDPWFKQHMADIKLAQGDPVAAQRLLDQIPLDFSPMPFIWDTRFRAALYLRDYDAANRVIAAVPAKWADFAFDGPAEWAHAQVARARGDKHAALAGFQNARPKEDASSKHQPERPGDISAIARYDAGLGRKEEAIGEARRAVELMPTALDSLYGPQNVANLALVYAWTGERDAALEQLEKIATLPGQAPTYGDLLLNPCWDELRRDPRFDKILAAAKAAMK